MTLRGRIFCGVLPLCPHPLDYSWLAVTSHWSKLSIMMFIVEHTVDSVASGEGWRLLRRHTSTLVLSSSSSLHSSFRLIWCLVCMTPATKPNRDNHFPVDFPWERQEEGGLFNIGPDAPEDQHWWKEGDHEADKVEMAQYQCSLCFFCDYTVLWDRSRQGKITRFCGFIHIYSTNIHFLFVTQVQFTDLSSISSYTLIYIMIRHFRISFTSLSTSFIHFFTYVHSEDTILPFRHAFIFIISQNKSANLSPWQIQP